MVPVRGSLSLQRAGGRARIGYSAPLARRTILRTVDLEDDPSIGRERRHPVVLDGEDDVGDAGDARDEQEDVDGGPTGTRTLPASSWRTARPADGRQPSGRRSSSAGSSG